jgi:hypothetical protein
MKLVKELIDKANISGFSEAELASEKDAELFRHAVNNYRRRNKVGENLTTNAVGKTVVIRKHPEVKVKEAVE